MTHNPADFMNKVFLEMLGIEFYSRYNFRDDGFVPGLARHYQKILEEFGFPSTIEDFKDRLHVLNHAHGFTYSFTKPDHTKYEQKYCIIFYLKGRDFYDLMARGHEETHALKEMGRIDLLETTIKNSVGNIPLRGRDSEFIANIGGFYVLDKMGYDISRLELARGPFFEPALKAYILAKQK